MFPASDVLCIIPEKPRIAANATILGKASAIIVYLTHQKYTVLPASLKHLCLRFLALP
jgi:hypothetical protein